MGGFFIFSGNLFLLSLMSFYDISFKKIPNLFILLMLDVLSITQAVNAAVSGRSPDLSDIAFCLAGALAPFVLMLPSELISGKGFGAGDKKLLMVLGLSTGAWGIITVIFGMLIGSAVYAFVKRVKRDEHIALAPFVLVSYFVYGLFRLLLLA